MIGDAKNACEQIDDPWIGARSVWQMRRPEPYSILRGPWVVTSRHAVLVDASGTDLDVVRARCGSIGPVRHMLREYFLESFFFLRWCDRSAADLVLCHRWTVNESKALTDPVRWRAPRRRMAVA